MRLQERGSDEIQLSASLSQIKKLYLALFRQLHASSLRDFDALDEDDMLLTLQSYLQRRAAQAGVDCTNHAAWDAFLGNDDAPGCERRLADRPRRTE
ncbi:MAG: hypothetical protein U1D55_00755 [Phycisphaerae bacterium]